MTGREAVEMVKMMNAMAQCVDTANMSLICNGQGGYLYSNEVSAVVGKTVTSIQLNVLTRTENWCDSPYDAVKKAYLEVYLEMEETKVIEVAMPVSILEALHAKADELGVPVDELVIEAMELDFVDALMTRAADCANCDDLECSLRA
jgi:hypothetical protein